MKDVRELFEGERLLVKTTDGGEEKTVVYGALLISSPDTIEDALVFNRGGYGYEYAVDSEDVNILPDGTIEFEAFDSKYVVREINDTDDMSNLNPQTEDEEEEE